MTPYSYNASTRSSRIPKRLNRKELEYLSEQTFGSRHSSARNKDELISRLLFKRHRVLRRLLGRRDRWWERSNTHFYGALTLIGTVIALVAFFFPRTTPSTSTPVDPLRIQGVLDQVERVLSSEPAVITNRLAVDRVPDTTKNVFELIEHSVVCDLRRFKLSPSVDHGLPRSPVVQTIRQRIKKLDDSPSYFLRAHTSGIDVFSASPSHPLTVHASDERNTYGEYRVKPRVLEFDVSEEPPEHEFALEVSKTFWNAFQNPDQSWAGIFLELPTRSISYLVRGHKK